MQSVVVGVVNATATAHSTPAADIAADSTNKPERKFRWWDPLKKKGMFYLYKPRDEDDHFSKSSTELRKIKNLRKLITVGKATSRRGSPCWQLKCPRGYSIEKLALEVGYTPALFVSESDLTVAKVPFAMKTTLQSLGLMK